MRVLLDSCLGARLRTALVQQGFDVATVADAGLDPGDAAVLARALAENRVLITLDADFGTLVNVQGLPHAGIVRLLVALPAEQAVLVVHIMNTYGEELAAGALVTADNNRVRIREAPTAVDEPGDN